MPVLPPSRIESRLSAALAEHPTGADPASEAADLMPLVLALTLAHMADQPDPPPRTI